MTTLGKIDHLARTLAMSGMFKENKHLEQTFETLAAAKADLIRLEAERKGLRDALVYINETCDHADRSYEHDDTYASTCAKCVSEKAIAKGGTP